MIREHEKTCIEKQSDLLLLLAKCWPYNRMIGNGEFTWCSKNRLLVELVIISFSMLEPWVSNGKMLSHEKIN